MRALKARIFHGRSGDALRRFRYGARYLVCDIDAWPKLRFPWALRPRDYGDGGDPRAWAERLTGLCGARITLVTLPRSFGLSFNPVSFWFVEREGMRAVIAEVSNTFGERHIYLIRHPDQREIAPSDRIIGAKLFHVSPFLPREGHYVFRFDIRGLHEDAPFGAWVTWQGRAASLVTTLTGQTQAPQSPWRAPLQTQRVIALILWQALLIRLRGLRFYPKPAQLTARITPAETVSETKNV